MFNTISTQLIKNEINMELMQNITDKFLCSLIKLITKVRLFILFNSYINIIFIVIRNKKGEYKY